MAELHLAYDDETFRREFEKMELAPGCITHEAHFRVAWVYLKKYDFDEALEKIAGNIQKMDRELGDGTKYHATITYAYVHLVANRMRAKDYRDWFHFIRDNQDLLTPVKAVLGNYYDLVRLFSDDARLNFLEPDRPFSAG